MNHVFIYSANTHIERKEIPALFGHDVEAEGAGRRLKGEGLFGRERPDGRSAILGLGRPKKTEGHNEMDLRK